MTTKTQLKRGKLSAKEIHFIRTNLDTMTDEEIGKAISRSPSLVAKRREQEPEAVRTDGLDPLVAELHAKHFWPHILKALLPHEIAYFEQEWAKLVHQLVESQLMFVSIKKNEGRYLGFLDQ